MISKTEPLVEKYYKSSLMKVLTRQRLEELYIDQEKSLEDIAAMFGCTRQAVQLIMEKKGVARRKKSQARVLAIKKDKFKAFEYDDINDSFFTRWTPEMAWVLGLLFTDGNVQRTKCQLKVSISSIDYDLLEKVRNLLGSTRAIKKKAQSYDKSKFIYSFEFYRERMRDNLHTLGLHERKSLDMQFPEVPEGYLRHFIRGCWDGDGSVFFSDGKLRASYVSGSLDFVKNLVDKLYTIGIYRRILRGYSMEDFTSLRSQYPHGHYPLKIHIEKRSTVPSYSLKIDSRDNLAKLFHYFYAGVDESLFLKRKYDVFVKGLFLTEDDIIKLKDFKDKASSIPREISSQIRSEDKDGHLRGNVRVLAVNNADGKLKCVECNEIHEMMYVTKEIYCPNCISRTVGANKK